MAPGLDLPEGVRAPVPPRTPWVGDILDSAAWTVAPDLPGADAEAAEVYGLEPAHSVIVLMVDGLGMVPLEKRLGYAPTLRNLASSPTRAQTCSPSTTAAALTTFTTGALPGQTSMVGYSVKHGKSSMTLLNFAPQVDPFSWQPVPTKFETFSDAGLDIQLITNPKFVGSGLTAAAFRGAKFVGRESLRERFDASLDLVRKGAAMQVVYWSDIDHVGHHFGPSSPQWSGALEEFDRELGVFLSRLPANVSVLMTADHGMVDVEERTDIAEVPALRQDVSMIAGEGRAVHLHARPGRGRQVVEAWSDYLGDRAWVVPQAQLPDLIGPGPGVARVGDAMVLMKDRSVIVDSRTQSAASIAQQGVHGSLTVEEMEIPVWRLA